MKHCWTCRWSGLASSLRPSVEAIFCRNPRHRKPCRQPCTGCEVDCEEADLVELIVECCGSCGASDVHDEPPAADKPTDRIRAVAPKITIEGVATELNGELRDGCWWFKDSATAQEFGRRTGAATFMNTGACDA